MDNNNNQPATPAPQPQPAQPSVQPPVKVGNSKMVIWLVGGLIVIILIAGGAFWYLSNKQTANQQSQRAGNTPLSKSAPTPAPENLDQQLNSIDVQAADSDFNSIDQDLQSL